VADAPTMNAKRTAIFGQSRQALESLYHALVTLSRPESRGLLRFRGIPKTTGAQRWSSWALTLVPGRTAQSLQRHHIGWQIRCATGIASRTLFAPAVLGLPSRPRRRAYGNLSGRSPLSSQYASPKPIRCLLNASRADMHWLAVLAAPFCSPHSPARPHRQAASLESRTAWLHEALRAKSCAP
jgi:hypothetical protein